MKKYLIINLLYLSLAASAADNERYSIIPAPLSLTEAQGEFKFTAGTAVHIVASDSLLLMDAQEIADDFIAQLKLTSGITLTKESVIARNEAISPEEVEPVIANAVKQSQKIVFEIAPGLKDEAYTLTISPQEIIIAASSRSGLYYGVQSLCQLLPAEIYGSKQAKGVRWEAPCCIINDEPRFGYRGVMLDVGRYFMPKELVMKFIDIMAMHKQNMFHWHLTEDQGWRIEIKKYPRLTSVGSVRKETRGYSKTDGDGIPHGGYYTQDDVREVVEYARKRCVNVIPEIELPGHALAAIAAYPELSCKPDSAYEVATTWGVKKDVFCPTAATFRFLEDVFTELFDLFPSPYYHIGGDECPRDAWKKSAYCQDFKKILGIDDEDGIQIFFVQRMAKFLKEKGNKTVIGWDEILDGGYVEGSVVMSYRGHAPAVRAVNRGMNTILTANRWNYIDYYQEDPEKEEKSQGLFLPLQKVYNYFPIPDTIPADLHKYFIGQQGSLWTEFVQTPRRAEYMAFPRVVAMSEVAWLPKENKDWTSFCQRMLKEFKRLDLKDVNYSRAFYNVIYNFDRTAPFPKNVGLTCDYPDVSIRYTTDGSKPTPKSAVYTDSIRVDKGAQIRAQAFTLNGKKVGISVEKTF